MHPLVQNVVGSYLDLVDAEASRLVEGVHLGGSALWRISARTPASSGGPARWPTLTSVAGRKTF
jgi:hypothetical protein